MLIMLIKFQCNPSKTMGAVCSTNFLIQTNQPTKNQPNIHLMTPKIISPSNFECRGLRRIAMLSDRHCLEVHTLQR